MKNPLWILNSSLLILFIVVMGIIIITQQQPVKRKPLQPQNGALEFSPKKEPLKVDITRIYTNDIFNTYKHPATPTEPAALEQLMALPQPPRQKMRPLFVGPQPNFLPPLAVELKGIIYSSRPEDIQAIIADARTGLEKLYAIGDKVEDAEIIRIGQNKIIVVRANGQQETLFLNTTEAQADPEYAHDVQWDTVIKRVNSSHYIVDPEKFVERISNLAHLFDMLNLTTVTYQNKRIGRRIGKLLPHSIGPALGLQKNDIITAINDIPTISTKKCVEIYNTLKNYTFNDIIRVHLIRNNQELELSYILRSLDEEEEIPQQPQKRMLKGNPLVAEKQTMDERKRDKNAMINHGGRNALLKRAV